MRVHKLNFRVNRDREMKIRESVIIREETFLTISTDQYFHAGLRLGGLMAIVVVGRICDRKCTAPDPPGHIMQLGYGAGCLLSNCRPSWSTIEGKLILSNDDDRPSV